MRLTRWKLMAGVLGLSMCGLAALAEPACRSVGITRRGEEPKQEPAEAAKPIPLPVPAPPPATEVPPPAVIPVVDEKKPTLTPAPIPIPEKNDPKTPPAVEFKLLEEVAKAQNPPVPLPSLSDPKKAEPVSPPITLSVPAPSIPVSREPATDLPAYAPPVTPIPAPTLTPSPFPVAVEPVVPVKSEKPLPEPKKAEIPPPRAVDPAPAPAALTEAPRPAGAVSNKKLKVMLHLSDEKPWFEVKDGDEVVLKVTADAVSLEAAAGPSKSASTLVAVGGVTFRTLGGYGTCDELRVVPGTGEVVVTGKVAVTSNWGKSETTATADKMTFRLGGDAKK